MMTSISSKTLVMTDLVENTKVVLNVVSDMLSIVNHTWKKGENVLSNTTKNIKLLF